MTERVLQGQAGADLMTAAVDNLAVHFTWVQRQTPGMYASTDDPALVLTDCGLPCDTFNAVCRARLTPEHTAEQVQRAVDHFRSAGRPFSWWLSPGDQPDDLSRFLIDAGLEPAETELAMAIDLDRVDLDQFHHSDEALSPHGLQIQPVRTLEQLRDFAVIVAANWTPPDTLVVRFYDLAAPVLLKPDCPLRFYVGYLDSVPVAASELTLGGGVGGLYSICTLENYRQRGFGTAMTLRPLLDARAAGYHAVILQASDAGARIYTRIGFETFGQITEYKPSF